MGDRVEGTGKVDVAGNGTVTVRERDGPVV